MTKKPLHRLPLDEWFDDIPHPYDNWPMAKDNEDIDYPPLDRNGESVYHSRKEEIDKFHEDTKIHQRMYDLATAKHSPWKGGGSENFQEKP
tara:strand:+ start:24558 stop:24830 length:273 start_codon:yes stop_codon:yes gene_type:complete